MSTWLEFLAHKPVITRAEIGAYEHFVAAVRRLNEAFPGVQVIGCFVARRRIPNPFADLV